MAGRKPLPTKVKQIKGTLQRCRTNLREPKPQGDLVDPPDYMPEGAKAAWYDDQGLARDLNQPGFGHPGGEAKRCDGCYLKQ